MRVMVISCGSADKDELAQQTAERKAAAHKTDAGGTVIGWYDIWMERVRLTVHWQRELRTE